MLWRLDCPGAKEGPHLPGAAADSRSSRHHGRPRGDRFRRDDEGAARLADDGWNGEPVVTRGRVAERRGGSRPPRGRL